MPFAIPFADRVKLLLEHPPASSARIEPALSPSTRAAVEAALDRGETHYTERPGILPLREKIALALSDRFRITTNADSDLVVTCGVTEARFIAIQQLLEPGGILSAAASSERLFGAALLRRVFLSPSVSANTQVLYLTSSTPEPELQASLRDAPATATILYEIDDIDEAAHRFHPAHLAGFAARTATIGSLFRESWRIGYLASPSNVSSQIRDFKQALTICTTNLSQWAALAAMEAQ